MPPVDWNEHKRLLATIINAFPDLHHEIEDIVTEGDKVAVRLTVTGTHKGEFGAYLLLVRNCIWMEMGFITITDGKITEGWISADSMRLMHQIGVTLQPSSYSDTTNNNGSQ